MTLSMPQVEDFLTEVAGRLPEAECATSRWGDWCIRYRGKTVTTLEQHGHGPCVVVKVPKAELPALLAGDGYSLAPYVGRYGWVCMRLSADTDSREIEEMVVASYDLFACR
jgi:predicted DNA-binding protein (MmcQ/YjbR family)